MRIHHDQHHGLKGGAGAAPAFRVMVADGQALVRAGFRALLEADGQISIVGEASTGEEAVALARSLRYDVWLIDATLPGRDRVEATGRIGISRSCARQESVD